MIDWAHANPGAWRRGTAIGLAALALGLVGATAAEGVWRSSPEHPAPTPAVDAGLVIAPRTLPVQARLSGDARLSGTLSPTIPGTNTLRLVVRDNKGATAHGGMLRLVTTMPGMRMEPIITTLVLQHKEYRGELLLPMFGTYRATILVGTPSGRLSGTMTLALLPPALMTAR